MSEGPVTTFEHALGREVRAQRARRGMKQADIVDPDVGLSLSSVQRIEKGQGATTRQLLGLAARFDMSVQDLIGAVEAEAAREPAPRRGVRVTRKGGPSRVPGHDSVKGADSVRSDG